MAEDSESSRQGLLPAREEVVDLLVRGVLAEAPALSVVAGEAGAGRSALLDAVGRDLVEQRVGVLRLRVGEQDRALPYSALYRLLVELGQDGQRAVTERNTVLGLVAKLGADAAAGHVPDEETSVRLATSVFAALRRYAPVVLLVDDAHRLDTATAGLVEHLVRRCAGGGCSIVATWCGPAPADPAAGYGGSLRELFDAGVARAFALRPLTRGQTAAVISHETAAVPDGELVERFARLSRGNLSALRTAIEQTRASGSLRVIDQHAYLGQGLGSPSLPEGHPMLARLRELPPLRRKVVAAMAVLCPVGATASSFVAEVLDVAEDTVVAEVGALVADRVLVRDRGGGWRFRHPLVREGLHSWSGPYERRWLCARGVTALWEGRARTDDEDLLPDLLVGAGGLVDRERSAKELQSNGGRLMFTDTARAVHWLRAAVQRTSDERERANAMVLHAAACALGDRMAEAVESSRDLLELHSDELSPGTLQQMQIVHVTALAAREQWDELERIANRTRSPWLAPQSGHEVVTRAFALVMLGRWADGELLLQQWQHVWSTANATTADFGRMVLGSAGVLLGDPLTVRGLTAEPKSWSADESPQFAFEYARHEVDMLLLLGELRPALERLRTYSTSVEQLHGSDRFLVQWLGGEHSTALETARRSMAEGESSARMLSPVMMSFDAARLLASRGWISRAQRMAEAGRGPQLGHVLDHVQSAILRFLGAEQEADELLRGGLHRAEEREHVLGTEHMWGDLARRERDLGAWERARECVHRTEELAWRLGTGRAELVHLVARVEVLGDPDAGREAVEVARERGTPYECATTFQRVALSGVDTKRLLLEAYELFGELDALLWRAQLRTTLRAHDITVPGRSTATRENERLLAVLVSEGLSNRQVATVFGTSEKSVEGRLTRMFAKSGYRSRVELTAALLRGEYPG